MCKPKVDICEGLEVLSPLSPPLLRVGRKKLKLPFVEKLPLPFSTSGMLLWPVSLSARCAVVEFASKHLLSINF